MLRGTEQVTEAVRETVTSQPTSQYCLSTSLTRIMPAVTANSSENAASDLEFTSSAALIYTSLAPLTFAASVAAALLFI